jgi:hypothetical protein
MGRRIVRTINNWENQTVSFELDDGDYISVDAREADDNLFMAAVLASINVNPDGGRVDVIQYGQKVGELPAWWHPGIGKSKHWLYDFRSHDLNLIDGKWVAHPTLGASDLDYLIGFVRKSPALFETLVFGGPLSQEMDRYSTWAEAEAGHRAMVERVRATEAEIAAVAGR